MTRPTLRNLVDLPSSPAPLSESALVLIDCQNTYTYGVMELDGVQAALEEAAALLDRARTRRHSDHPYPARRRIGLALRRYRRDRGHRELGRPARR